MARIVFLVCHLSGTGHLVRILTLARCAAERGHAVTVLSGGRPLSHLETEGVGFVQLPWLAVEGLEFNRMLGPDGSEAGPALLAERKEQIVAAIDAFAPDMIVAETWPFGRRALAAEFEAAFAARPGARRVCSVRDVPEPKPRRLEEVAARLGTFDGVLVHGDPAVIGLNESWPLPDTVAARVRMTGYLGRPVPQTEKAEEILVGVGGGSLGEALLPLAVRAASHSTRRWRILVGGSDPMGRIAALGDAGETSVVEPLRHDYPALLSGAAASVSLAGYNTMVELMQNGTPALLVPSEEGGEREQSLRARALARYDGIEWARATDLTPETLAARADALADLKGRPRVPVEIDRGERAIGAMEEILEER